MTVPSYRPLALLLTLVVVLAACSSPGATSAAPTPTAPAATAPSVTTGPAVSQTETDWGPIWDAVPERFPRYPGGTSSEDAGAGPASAVYALPTTDPSDIASWVQTAMETATYSTEAMSGPFEDGGFVIDSVGDGACRIQTRVDPLGGLLLVTVLYGTGCPAP